MFRMIAVFGLICSFSGCSDNSKQTARDGSRNTPASLVLHGTPSVKQLPPEYRVLAEQLSLDIKSSPDEFHNDKSMADAMAEIHLAIMELKGVQSSDSDLKYIADQGLAGWSEFVSSLERLNALPAPPSQSEVMVTSFFAGLAAGDPISGMLAGGTIGADAEQKKNSVAVEVQGMIAGGDKADAAHMMLPKIAERYAATPTTGMNRFVIDINASWGAFGPNDWFCVNNNGDALDDCTIQVQLTGATGQVRKNVHFVRHWPARTWMYAKYEPGQLLLGQQTGRMTVSEIQKAEVSVWSPKFTSSQTYTYQGAEKDKDIAERCSKINLTGRYQPFVKGTLWSTQRGCYFTLNGFPYTPKGRATVTFKKGKESKAFGWDFDSWKAGEEKYFGTTAGQLEFDPDSIDIALSFPGTSYQHKVNLQVVK